MPYSGGAITYSEWLETQSKRYPPINAGSAVIPPPSSDFMVFSNNYIDWMEKSNKFKKDEISKYQDVNFKNYEWLSDEYKKYSKRKQSFGIIIFIVTIIIIFAGIGFSGVQLFFAIKYGTTELLTTSAGFGKSGIYFSSSLVGGFVLFISLGFFYLFLKHVYNVDPPPSIPIINPIRPEDQ